MQARLEPCDRDDLGVERPAGPEDADGVADRGLDTLDFEAQTDQAGHPAGAAGARGRIDDPRRDASWG